MTRISRRQALAATALLATAAAGRAAAAPGVPVAADMAMGNAKARITVVEYASLSCGHCAHFNETVFPDFKKKYVDTGRVRYVMKEFLTAPANVAAAGFLLARCGGSGPAKYFKIVDEVFRSQAGWKTGADVRASFVKVAAANGMSEAQFNACLADEKALAALNARVKQAVDDGIQGTPSFYVNGKPVEVESLADLDAAIAAATKGGRRAS
jgi:protein-disulfide isomerase